MPTTRDALAIDEAQLRAVAERLGSEPLTRLADHEHPLHGGWLGDGDERQDWVATMLMDCYRQTRDRDAMDLVYRLYAAQFRRLIAHRLRSCRVDADADDLLQETFFAICRYPDGFRADRAHAFRCWAFRIVYNTVANAVRARVRRPARVESLDACDVEFAADAPTPARAASDREEAAAVARSWLLVLQSYLNAYEQLSEADRALLLAVEVVHRPYPQLAEELGCGVPALKVRVFRARRRVESRLKQLLDAGRQAA